MEMNDYKKDLIVAPEECKMMDMMVKAGFTKLHPGGKFSTEKILKLCDIDSEKRIIDIGCGPGETAIYIAKKFGCHVLGVDIMPEMIKRATENAMKQKVDHLTTFETIDVMSHVYPDDLFDVAIFQAVLFFGDKQKMLSYAYNVLKDDGQVGAIEITWRKEPSEEIKVTFVRNLTEPIINAETTKGWTSAFRRAGFDKIACKELYPMNIKTFIVMWKGEGLRNKIKIPFKALFDKKLGMIKRMSTLMGLFNKYPDYLGYGLYLGQK